MELEKNSQIILSLDVLNKKKAFEILNETYELIDGVKINYVLIFNTGINICNDIKMEFDLPIIGDFKIADVPFTNNRIADICYLNSIDFLTVHGIIGQENLNELKDYTKGKISLFMITDFTCSEEPILKFDEYAKLAYNLDFYGVQAPANKPDVIKEVRTIIGNSKMIISCGVVTQGVKVGNAIKYGADFEIIGRGIYLANNPRRTTEKFKQVIENVVSC